MIGNCISLRVNVYYNKASYNGRVKNYFMKNKKLLSIGELSRLSGVHIKSLRYYDSIGVLLPAYVNPENGYRYYSFNQVYLVDCIQLCVELGIPLKEFHNFVSDDKQTIYYDKLFSHGKLLATEKISQIHQHLDLLDQVQKEMKRSVQLEKHIPKLFNLEERVCWVSPYNGKGIDSFNLDLKKLFFELNDIGIPTLSNEVGIVQIWKNGLSNQYIYMALETNIDSSMDFTRTLVFPKGKYLCMECSGDDIEHPEQIFPKIKNTDAIIIETEMFLQSYNFIKPRYEMRCFIF